MNSRLDLVYTIHDWYDGPRSGAAEYVGATYWYRSVYLDTEEWKPDEDRFELALMTSEALSWDLERTSIFERWDTARRNGLIEWKHGDNESFGAFPDEMPRYRELNNSMDEFLKRATPLYLVRGLFLEPRCVQWLLVGSLPGAEQGAAGGARNERA